MLSDNPRMIRIHMHLATDSQPFHRSWHVPPRSNIHQSSMSHRRRWHSDQSLGSSDLYNLRIFIVAKAIVIHVASAVTTADAQGVELVAVTVAVALGCQCIRTRRWRQGRCRCRTRRVLQHMDRRRTNAIGILIGGAVITHAQSVELVAVAVAVAFGMSEHPHS